MNFENIYKETEENLRLALLSLWTPGNHPMRPAIEDLFKREPLLAEPVFQSTFGWEPTDSDDWRKTLNGEVIEELHIGEMYLPYKHQAKSWQSLSNGHSIVVTSGTGSGKTECFMYPVISDLYEQNLIPNHERGIEAIFLYPLNALMEDQKKRLSNFCQSTGLHFAVYNGDTPEYKENWANRTLPNEIATREGIRNDLPEILLSNPSMLEYMLVRQRDQDMLQKSSGKLRWIIIDEAHSYSGSAAVELAFQIKRILEAFHVSASNVRFACTSATIGGEDGIQSLKEFISTITGQSTEQIDVIGGNRIVRPLNEQLLAEELNANGLSTTADKVISLRSQMNVVAGMTLQQIWEWLCPDEPYIKENLVPALRLIDNLCDISQSIEGQYIPILSLRGHFFMRAINGLYGCANHDCPGVNTTIPQYGHLTTYKSSVCSDCGATMYEIVQCKQCNGFILMGSSDRGTRKFIPCKEEFTLDDYFTIDDDSDSDNDDDLLCNNDSNTSFLAPYDREHFFIPVNEGIREVFSLDISSNGTYLSVNDNGDWVSVTTAGTTRGVSGSSYCPNCGRLAQGAKLNFKHFRIPINFINQTISPVFLKESANDQSSWGKYIAFTDSRQGTAISAKSFNINVERKQARQNMMQWLSENGANLPSNLDLSFLPEATRRQIIELIENQEREISLSDLKDVIFDRDIFDHLTVSDKSPNEGAYKAALIRNFIGRRPLYENNVETLGLVTLFYPGISNIQIPNQLRDFAERMNIQLQDKDWQDYLKLMLDYFMRMGNHIQPLIDYESRYIRESNYSSPVAGPDDRNNTEAKHWPLVRVNTDGNVSMKQPRSVLLLCAGLGIRELNELNAQQNFVNGLLRKAWNDLIVNGILKKVKTDTDTATGYNIRKFEGRYANCYYLDLSGERNNGTAVVRLTKDVWKCPVTNKFLDTTFCGYSPYITGRLTPKLFERFHCERDKFIMPKRPSKNEDVDAWMNNDTAILSLKDDGFWNDIYKYTYKKTCAYLAAEHSAQQSKKLLSRYTDEFSQVPPIINVLHCSTTMEMGVDIGDIDIVLMDTVPPTAANYLQRVGRAGRMGQSKSVAFSLCNNTPVGQYAFADPMWALKTSNHMIKVRPSQVIVQRHVNSYFFRQFICNNGEGIQVKMEVDEFMANIYQQFIDFLDSISINDETERNFYKVFGINTPYTIGITRNTIEAIKNSYDEVVTELTDAFNRYSNDTNRQLAISHQLRKYKSANLLSYLSEHQFIPNANMPTNVVTFDFIGNDQIRYLNGLYSDVNNLRDELANSPDVDKPYIEQELNRKYREIEDIKRSSSASRDLRTALNEYAPGQTVVINEKNYVSAGIILWGEYDERTQTRAIYHCYECGHTEYRANLQEGLHCPICNTPFRSIIDRDHGTYTWAYEPVGFRTDQKEATRTERTEKRFYDIRPVLLNVDWNNHVDINMCQIVSSGENGNILYYNAGSGHGFAFCKKCGRAAIEYSASNSPQTIPNKIKAGHPRLWSNEECAASDESIARHVVFTGNHPTCYVAMRFMKDCDNNEFEKDEQLLYSLGVVLKRALAQGEGIDEGEVEFGVKQEKDARVLFIFDTAKGGCGYSLRFLNPVLCQEIFDIARDNLEKAACNCQDEGGACTSCLIDRNSYRFANLLSKSKVLNWLHRQKGKKVEVPQEIRLKSPSAKVVYQSLHDIFKQAVDDSDVCNITLCVSDLTDDTVLSEWTSIRSEFGKLIARATNNGKKVNLLMEYHPELHHTLTERIPFIDLKLKLSNCDEVDLIKNMERIKTAIVVNKVDDTCLHYFTDQEDVLSFSSNWGKNCNRLFMDDTAFTYEKQDQPSYEEMPNQVVREGTTDITSFVVSNYFSKAIASILQPDDIDLMKDILFRKVVNITFSDMYVNSALSSLMLVYLIQEIKNLFGLTINNVTLQLDSPKRKCNNEHFNDWTYINLNFEKKEDADEYTNNLFKKVLDVEPDFSPNDADHHRWLKIETTEGGIVEIRPDHGISGGYKSDSKYMNLNTLNGSVLVTRNNEEVLYYIIIRKGDR
jgi:superfamily II DNA/RNA helicase/rubrerythrin